ncbi:hypothetical protein GEMRC1_002332 [Eukaryota sp. GEM-RC1]
MFYPLWLLCPSEHDQRLRTVYLESIDKALSTHNLFLTGKTSTSMILNYCYNSAARNCSSVWFMPQTHLSSNPPKLSPNFDRFILKKIGFKYYTSSQTITDYLNNIHLLQDHELPGLLVIDSFENCCRGSSSTLFNYSRVIALGIDAADHVTSRLRKLDENDAGCLLIVIDRSEGESLSVAAGKRMIKVQGEVRSAGADLESFVLTFGSGTVEETVKIVFEKASLGVVNFEFPT